MALANDGSHARNPSPIRPQVGPRRAVIGAMNTTAEPPLRDDADRDSELYLRVYIDAEELVRRARERVQPATTLATSQVKRF